MIKLKNYTETLDKNKYTEHNKEKESFDDAASRNCFDLNDYNEAFTNIVSSLQTNTNFSVLELGCGLGKVTLDFLRYTNNVVGLDGRDGYRLYKDMVLTWLNNQDKLLHCNIGQPFELVNDLDELQLFDCILSFECFEHIHPDDIDNLFQNIAKHSKIGTYFFGTISNDRWEASHRCVRPYEWWISQFANIGFSEYSIDLGQNLPRVLPSSSTYALVRTK